ncbi:MAG: hypothetical protein AB1671_02120 [Thermodesulfobacteriota bacterium]|jgi:hypothetical protein
MRKRLACGGVLFACFLTAYAASPAPAVITVTLENPADLQDVSGIALVSGWAFASNGQPVTVRLRINGATHQDFLLPCCGPRADVRAAVPGAPLDVGFGAVINYGLPAFTAGPNTVGVEVSAPGESPEIRDHMVVIAKPAGAEFLTTFDLSSANSAVDGPENQLVIGGAVVTPLGSTAGVKTNLRASYATNSQSLVIGEAFNGPNAALFAPVQDIFTRRCAVSGCHAGPFAQAALDLSAGQAFRNIVAARSVEDPSRPRVSPGSALSSYLYQKVIPNGDIIPGTARMPLGCAGETCLSDGEIQAIERWITDGARPAE